MNTEDYLRQFNTIISSTFTKEFEAAGLHYFVGIVMNSVAIKVYQPQWAGNPADAANAEGRLFFSIWVNKESIAENKLLYNIHALKLRSLNNHKIKSRDFAQRFRTRFAAQQKNWPNVSINHGPQTLMEGWLPLHSSTLQTDIEKLLHSFLSVNHLIDETLHEFKR